MTLKIEELKTLVTVIEAGGITAAARRLGVAKSAVSKQVAQLEAALQAALFRRVGNRLEPTDVGMRTYEGALPILASVDGLAESVMSERALLAGIVRMAAPLSFGRRYLGPIMLGFMVEHPKIEIHLDLDDRLLDLRAGGFDVALRIGDVKDAATKPTVIGTSTNALYCSPAYAARQRLPTEPAMLEQHACLVYANGGAGHIYRFVSPNGDGLTLSPAPRLRTNDSETLCDATVAGLGIARLPGFLARDALADGRLVSVPMGRWTMPDDAIFIVQPGTGRPRRRVGAVIAHVASHIAATLTARP